MKHTPGKLSLWTSNSFRRFGTTGDSDAGLVCEPVTQRDGHPDLHFRNGGAEGPDARRIVACWNACSGIPTEELELFADSGELAQMVDEVRMAQ